MSQPSDKRFREEMEKYTSSLNEIQEKVFEKETELAVKYRNDLIEPELKKRKDILQKIDGFWGVAFTSRGSPVAEFLNSSIDPKLTRAITDFSVDFFVKDKKSARKVSITLRQNIYTEAGEYSRTLNSDGETLEIKEMKWKEGTDKVRRDSLFSLFTADENEDLSAVEEAFDALDSIYQNPFH